MIKLSFVNSILLNTKMVNSMLTVMPYLMISFIRSSSIVARKVSLGCSISGTTSSRIFATLQITMKSFCVYRDKISALWISKSQKKLYIVLCISGYSIYECNISVKKIRKEIFKVRRKEYQTVSRTWILTMPLTCHMTFESLI